LFKVVSKLGVISYSFVLIYGKIFFGIFAEFDDARRDEDIPKPAAPLIYFVNFKHNIAHN